MIFEDKYGMLHAFINKDNWHIEFIHLYNQLLIYKINIIFFIVGYLIN
jgi:hypothetical protein